jgi:hypothetical protein
MLASDDLMITAAQAVNAAVKDTALDSRFSGRGPLRPAGHGGGNPLPASPDLRANCCSTSHAAVEAVRRARFGM